MTTDQSAKLSELAKAVHGEYTSIDIAEVLNRIHYITGRDYQKCIAGLKMMVQEKLFAPDFISRIELLPKLEKMINKTFPLMESLEAAIVTCEVNPASDGPREDQEFLLSHLTADF